MRDVGSNIFLFHFLIGFSVSALTIIVPDEIHVPLGGTAKIDISLTLEGKTFEKVTVFNSDSTVVFKVAKPRTIWTNGTFYGSYQARGSTNFYHGLHNFHISISKIQKSDEGTWKVTVAVDDGTVPISKTFKIVIGRKYDQRIKFGK